MEYEYVSKSEYRPMREEIEQIINRVHKYMRKHHDTTFQHRLIGSGKRHLQRHTGRPDLAAEIITPRGDPGYSPPAERPPAPPFGCRGAWRRRTGFWVWAWGLLPDCQAAPGR